MTLFQRGYGTCFVSSYHILSKTRSWYYFRENTVMAYFRWNTVEDLILKGIRYMTLFQSWNTVIIFVTQFDNAFVFVMGDHGMRQGGIRWTAQGEIEDNNPAFFLTLPRHLRANRALAGNLRANARQLFTHFDVHATLLSIAKVQDKTRTHFRRMNPNNFAYRSIRLIELYRMSSNSIYIFFPKQKS